MEIALITFNCEVYAVINYPNELTGNKNVIIRKVNQDNTIRVDGKDINVEQLSVNKIQEEWV